MRTHQTTPVSCSWSMFTRKDAAHTYHHTFTPALTLAFNGYIIHYRPLSSMQSTHWVCDVISQEPPRVLSTNWMENAYLLHNISTIAGPRPSSFSCLCTQACSSTLNFCSGLPSTSIPRSSQATITSSLDRAAGPPASTSKKSSSAIYCILLHTTRRSKPTGGIVCKRSQKPLCKLSTHDKCISCSEPKAFKTSCTFALSVILHLPP